MTGVAQWGRVSHRRLLAAISLLCVVYFAFLPSYAEAEASAHGVVDVQLAQLGPTCQNSAPVTFGQPFRPGDVPRGDTIVAVHDGKPLPTQFDVMARNADGSVRHGIVTVIAPCGGKAALSLELRAVPENQVPTAGSSALAIDDVLASRYNAGITFDSDGKTWHQSARALLAQIGQQGGCDNARIFCRHWLSGPLAGEWVVGAPPVDDSGKAHPRLMVFFAVRAYGPPPVQAVRTDTIIENDWAYDVDPQNVVYDARLTSAGKMTSVVKNLTHYRQARWHRVQWWGQYTAAPWFAALNGRYLQATPAVPRYQSIQLDNAMLAKVPQQCAPMDHCDVEQRMEATGAQPQIGPLPMWSTAYLVDPHDYRAYRWMLANSDALGAYAVHYRQRDTDEALSIDDHPCATLIGAAEQPTCKVAPHADDRLPSCKQNCQTPLEPEIAHAPAPAYVAYLVTGDWFYAQELAFWASWTIFQSNPGYRDYRDGLVQGEQLRGQAWALRTLGDAAYLLPDDFVNKALFNHVVQKNIQWYNAHYTDDASANKLGAITNGYAMSYGGPQGHDHVGIATWQMSFFTWAAGNLADQGFAGANKLRDYASRFQVGTLTAPGFCPELASAYTLKIRSTQDAPLYPNFADVYKASFPDLARRGCGADAVNAGLKARKDKEGFPFPPGTMAGYPNSDTGFVANLQIGAAAAADSDQTNARKAWDWFMSRPVRPDYRHAPQFSVIPTSP